MTASPEIATLIQLFDDKFAEVEELLTGLEPAALLWKPFEFSPWKGRSAELGVVLSHTISSTMYLLRRAEWACERIEWDAVQGDEGATEFGPANYDPAYMIERNRRAQQFVRDLLPTFTSADLDRVRPLPHRPDRARNARQDVVHALEHMSQHIGHAQITRQLWALPTE